METLFMSIPLIFQLYDCIVYYCLSIFRDVTPLSVSQTALHQLSEKFANWKKLWYIQMMYVMFITCQKRKHANWLQSKILLYYYRNFVFFTFSHKRILKKKGVFSLKFQWKWSLWFEYWLLRQNLINWYLNLIFFIKISRVPNEIELKPIAKLTDLKKAFSVWPHRVSSTVRFLNVLQNITQAWVLFWMMVQWWPGCFGSYILLK